jgi:hypothetical protein
MPLARIATITITASVLWCATAGAGGPLRPFKHGLWTGGAYTDDRTGAFTHCSAGVAYDGGINLFVLATGGHRWWLGFTNPKWHLSPNASGSLKLEFDDSPPVSGLVSIPSGQLLLVSLPDDPNLLAAFHRSSRLALNVEGQSFSFKLRGTLAVMEQLADCVRSSVALEAQAPTPPASTASAPNSAPAGAVASPAPSSSPAVTALGAAAAPAETAPAAAAASTAGGAPVGSVTADLSAPAAETTSPAHAAPSGAESGSNRAGGFSPTALPSARSRPPPQSAEKPATTAQTRFSPSAAPPLAFTSVAPVISVPPSTATASVLSLRTPTANEEVQLATNFFTKARLPDARLVVADKPPALADFDAVWRSEDAAGAVKIIPAEPDVRGIDIASHLIAVDPQLCKGDFSAARFRTDIGNSVVFSAVLSCSEANEQRITEYFITPRHQGGFIVFAVIRSKAVDQTPGFDRQKIDVLSRAAVEAAEGQG